MSKAAYGNQAKAMEYKRERDEARAALLEIANADTDGAWDTFQEERMMRHMQAIARQALGMEES